MSIFNQPQGIIIRLHATSHREHYGHQQWRVLCNLAEEEDQGEQPGVISLGILQIRCPVWDDYVEQPEEDLDSNRDDKGHRSDLESSLLLSVVAREVRR